ncbi:MAG: zinc ribbon domain-containing protein [Betaproteobacteria bacterium]|nr:MAG: zinc ribbon domain-containing protein [Betaproteobacteria bacterium]
MPIYEYAPTSGHCEKCNGGFEVIQRLADAKLTSCPSCGQPCERRISKVALGGTWSLSESKIRQSGLTQYKKVDKGVYERTAGAGGPEHLFRN